MGTQKLVQKDELNEINQYDGLRLKDGLSDGASLSDGGIADEDFDEEDIADADGVSVVDDDDLDLDDEHFDEGLEDEEDESDFALRGAV